MRNLLFPHLTYILKKLAWNKQGKPRHRDRSLMDAVPAGIIWLDEFSKIVFCNSAIKALSGYTRENLRGKHISFLLPKEVMNGNSECRSVLSPIEEMSTDDAATFLHRDGTQLFVQLSFSEWKEGLHTFQIIYLRDLTESRKLQVLFYEKTTLDDLTGLPNRNIFYKELETSLKLAIAEGRRLTLLLIDLDDFKSINTGLGHELGDQILRQVGACIKSELKPQDILARLGGDEFGILLTDEVDKESAEGSARKILEALKHVYCVNGFEVFCAGSIGLAHYPDDASDPRILVRYAHMAMHKAKQTGHGEWAPYSADMNSSFHEDMIINVRLNDAMRDGFLRLNYQPQVDINTQKIIGVEALLRWTDPVLGEISPARFIPVAEASGLILQLSDWVLETACKQIAKWTAQGIAIKVAVNFSAQQFKRGDLHENIRKVLERTGAKGKFLVIEITESIAMEQPEQARRQLAALAAMECGIALDDFGTGYSSLAYLKALPVQTLKIDHSFIKGIPEDPDDVAICKTVIALAHSLGMQLIAEGVETDTQLALLKEFKCEAYQGWHFSKAIDACATTKLLNTAMLEQVDSTSRVLEPTISIEEE